MYTQARKVQKWLATITEKIPKDNSSLAKLTRVELMLARFLQLDKEATAVTDSLRGHVNDRDDLKLDALLPVARSSVASIDACKLQNTKEMQAYARETCGGDATVDVARDLLTSL